MTGCIFCKSLQQFHSPHMLYLSFDFDSSFCQSRGGYEGDDFMQTSEVRCQKTTQVLTGSLQTLALGLSHLAIRKRNTGPQNLAPAELPADSQGQLGQWLNSVISCLKQGCSPSWSCSADVKRNRRTDLARLSVQFSSVRSLNRVRLFATPWIAAHQVSLSINNSRSLLKLMSTLQFSSVQSLMSTLPKGKILSNKNDCCFKPLSLELVCNTYRKLIHLIVLQAFTSGGVHQSTFPKLLQKKKCLSLWQWV